MNVKFSQKFLRNLRKSSKEVEQKFREKYLIFLEDPFHVSLKTHKLHGEMKNRYAFSITYGHRVVFEEKDGTFLLADIGLYDDVY